MKIIIVTIFYLLLSASVYAADTPDTKVSYAAEKAEEVIQDNELPDRINFTIPTEGGQIEYLLKTKKNESIDLDTFGNLIGRREIVGLVAYLYETPNGQTTSYSPYMAQNIIRAFNKQNIPLNPLTNNEALNTYFSLVEEKSGKFQTTFLGDWQSNGIVQKLCTKLSENPNDIEFYTFAGNTYYRKSFHAQGLSEENARFSITFFKKALAAIATTSPADDIFKQHKIDCFRRCGNIYAEFHKAHKKADDASLALQYYKDAIDSGDHEAISKHDILLDQADGNYLRNSEHGKLYLKKLRDISRSQPSKDNYLKLANLYSKIGNASQGNFYLKLAYGKISLPSILQSRKRNHDQDSAISNKQPKLN